MKLTAIQIDLGGNKKRIVGKVGMCPKNSSLPQLEGYNAFYKEEFYKDCVSYKLKCTGVDYAAWEKAKELGAKGLIIFCKDNKKMITVGDAKIDQCRKIDLGGGEGVQIRIPLTVCKIYENKLPIPFGWTNKIETVKPKQGWIDEEPQKELFQ